MKTSKKESRYVSLLTVYTPSAEALVDMMRFDRCCPHTEEEAQKIQRLFLDESNMGTTRPADHVVTLMRFAAANTPATEGRWQSFGCAVLDERSPDESPLTPVELASRIEVAKASKRIRW